MHEATLTFDYPTADRASIVAQSVGREVTDLRDDRSHARIDRTDSIVTVDVEASDRTALRAALNTWLSLVQVAESTAAAAASESAD